MQHYQKTLQCLRTCHPSVRRMYHSTKLYFLIFFYSARAKHLLYDDFVGSYYLCLCHDVLLFGFKDEFSNLVASFWSFLTHLGGLTVFQSVYTD